MMSVCYRDAQAAIICIKAVTFIGLFCLIPLFVLQFTQVKNPRAPRGSPCLSNLPTLAFLGTSNCRCGGQLDCSNHLCCRCLLTLVGLTLEELLALLNSPSQRSAPGAFQS